MKKNVNKKNVKIGIIGCADIAKKYTIKAFQAIDTAEVVSIASRDFDKAKEFAGQFGIHADKSYDSLLKREDVDTVYIPLPVSLHEEWVLKAAKANKNVMCEKSLSDNFDSAKKIVDFCKSKGVVLYENFMCDFHPQHSKVLSMIADGSIGEMILFNSSFGIPPRDINDIRYKKELGGGSLNDVGAYTVFMARKIFAEEPVAVNCSLFNDEKFNVDMSGSGLLEFPQAKSALVGFSLRSLYQNNYSVWGTKGLIRVSRAYSIPPDMKPPVELYRNENMQETITSVEVQAANQFELIFKDFCNTILNKEKKKEKIEKTYSKILLQAKVLEAMRISSKERRRVEVKEVE
jgi:predicted dehydrogenase